MTPELNGNDCSEELSSLLTRDDDEDEDDESEFGDRELPFFEPTSILFLSPILFMDNEEDSILLIVRASAAPSMSEIGNTSTLELFKLKPFLSKEMSWIPEAFETDNLFFTEGDIRPLLLLSNDGELESLEAPRIFLRSFDLTFNELPVDNFVIVTEPIDGPLVDPGELGSLDSETFEDELEVTVDDKGGFSDPKFKDGCNLSLDELEEFDELLDELLYDPVDIESLHLTGEMVTPSPLLLFGGVLALEPNSLPIASSTLSFFKSLFCL